MELAAVDQMDGVEEMSCERCGSLDSNLNRKEFNIRVSG